MDYYLRLHGVCGTKNELRKLKAVSKNRTAMSAGDDGVTPVIAVAMLIGMVTVAGIIIGLAMFAALGDASGTLPDVRFQASADGVSLYHAGGDALPLKSLVFYDREMMPIPDFNLIKGGSTEAVSPEEQDVWETGDRIQFDELEGLSIVGLDSRGNPALLWRGVNAMVLPVGDMVPDVWEDLPISPIQPGMKYTIYVNTTWEELLGRARHSPNNGINIGQMRGVNNTGYQEYWYIGWSNAWLSKTDGENHISIEDYIKKVPNSMFKMDFTNIRNSTDIIQGPKWKPGKAPEAGTLFEDEDGVLYVWYGEKRSDNDSWSTKINEAHWNLVGIRNS